MSVIYVDCDAAGANNGTSWADAFTSMQDALAAMGSGDQVWAAEGTYTPTAEVGGAGDEYKTFQLKNGAAVYGGFDGTETALADRDWFNNETILSGELGATDAYHVFYHPSGTNLDSTAVLDGFTICDGYAAGGGAHSNGGGIHNVQSSPTVRNCRLTSNYAGSSGAAIYNDNASPAVHNCRISDNTADGADGAVTNTNASSPVYAGCAILDNVGDSVGGMANRSSSDTSLVNCTIHGNAALSSASIGAGGIYNDDSSDLAVTNSIVWGNSAASPAAADEIYNNTTGAVAIDYSYYANDAGDVEEGSDWTETGCSHDDPAFVSAADRSLLSISPCINAGDDSSVPAAVTTDVVGAYRFSGGVVDIGAYEYQYTLRLQYTAGDNGSVTGDLDETIDYHGTGSAVTAVPDAGYSFGAWDDGSTDNPRTDAAVTADVDVRAIFTLDGLSAVEHQASRSITNDQSATLIYVVSGSSDQGEILASAEATSPASFEGLDRDAVDVVPLFIDTNNESACRWRVEVAYRVKGKIRPATGDSVYSFDTSGGTEHVTQALELSDSVGGFADHQKAINYDGEHVNGVDITVPRYSWTETHYLAANAVSFGFKASLFKLTGRVNNASFRGFAAGEVLFLGASGAKRSEEDWEITYHFAASPNAVGLPVEGLGSVDKKGWDYLWVRYEQAAGTKGLYPKPIQADVDKVYRDGNFAALGIGTAAK